jgi:hypothetical protein
MSETLPKPELLPFEPGEPLVLSKEDQQRPIWELISERVERIPPGVLEPMPDDGADNHDHYLYGAPKRISE